MPTRLALGHRVGGTGCERSRIRHDKLLPQRPASRNLWRRRYCSSRKDRVRHVRLCCWDPLLENRLPVVRRHSPEGVARHASTGGNSTDSGRLSALVFMSYGRKSADHRSWVEGMCGGRQAICLHSSTYLVFRVRKWRGALKVC